MLTAAVSAAGATPPLLRFEKAVAALDTVLFDGGPVTVKFVCENISSSPVSIIDVHSQCGCTDAQFGRGSIAPGKKAEVRVTLDPSGLMGQQAKHLTVVAGNGEYRRFNTITVECYVKRDKDEAEIRYPYSLGYGLRSDLGSVGLRMRTAGEKVPREFTLFNDSDKELSLGYKKNWRIVMTDFPKTIAPKQKLTVKMRYNTRSLPKGEFTDSLFLKVNGTQAKGIALKGTIK